MSGSTILVKTGAPTQIQGAPLPAGTIIVNNDSVNAVWVAAARSVSPGNGIKVPPLGSVQWSAPANALAWACVDSGVATGVSLTYSTDANTLNNPVEVGAAVAAQIVASGLAAAIGVQVAEEVLLTGVPNVLITTTLPGVINATPTDVHGYASLTVTFPGAAAAFETQFFFTDANGTQIGPTDTIANVVGGAYIPVLGPFIVFPNLAGQQVEMDGSNRQLAVTHPIVAGYSSEGWTMTIPSRTWVVGDSITFTPVKGQAFQGPAYAYLTISGTVVLGTWQANTPSGTIIVLADTGETHTAPQNRAVGKMIALPANISSLTFVCSGTGGVASVNAYLAPAY